MHHPPTPALNKNKGGGEKALSAGIRVRRTLSRRLHSEEIHFVVISEEIHLFVNAVVPVATDFSPLNIRLRKVRYGFSVCLSAEAISRSSSAGKVVPACAAACGRRLVGVMPGIVLTSITCSS